MQQIPVQDLPQYISLSQSMGGVYKGKSINYPVAFLPFATTKARYDYYCQLQTAWQRVLLRVAQDHDFLIGLLDSLTEGNDLLKGNLDILKKVRGRPLKEGICVNRIDYYQDLVDQPKLIQYNLLCVGFQANSEKMQKLKKTLEKDQSYFDNLVVANCTEAICQLLKKKEGIVLIVAYDLSQRIPRLDIRTFQDEFAKRSVKSVVTDYLEMAQKLSIKENGDLYFGDQKVAVVYNRITFRLSDYMFGEDYDITRSWKAKQMICSSNTFSIPPIEFEMVNSKRVQTELSKPQVLRRYASQEDASLLLRTRVREWEFDSILEEQLQAVRAAVHANPNGYLLKPNLQGGGNNLYGEQVLQKLQEGRSVLRFYILMEMIETKQSRNILVDGQKIFDVECEYEICCFGTLTWLEGQIVRNNSDGFLAQAKPSAIKEGGIMNGSAAIMSWKLHDK